MGPRQFIEMLRRQWLAIASCVAVFLLLGLGATLLTAKTYQATAELFVTVNYYGGPSGGGQPAGINSTSDFALAQVASYARLANSPQVLGVPGSGGGRVIPSGDISATNPPATVLIDVTATSKWPGDAKDKANLVAERLARFIPKVAPRLPDGRVAVSATVTQPATRPASPSSPRAKLNLAIGLLLGLASGLALALIRDAFASGREEPRRPAHASD